MSSEQSYSEHRTRLHAVVRTEVPGYTYANGDEGLTVRVVYEGKPFEPLEFTLTEGEARAFAAALEAQADELKARSYRPVRPDGPAQPEGR